MGMSQEFHRLLGAFQVAWAATELLTDFAIYKFLKVTPEQAHLITSGMMFGRKARLLADLIGRSDHPNKAAILGAFNKVRGPNKRDIIAHSYLQTSESSIRFVERTGGGEYKALAHRYTVEEFRTHVDWFCKASMELWEAVDATREEVTAFGEAAFSANRSPSTSPQKPQSKE